MAPEKEPTKKLAAADSEDDDDIPIGLRRSWPVKDREAPRKREAEDEDEDDRLLLARSKVLKKISIGSDHRKVKKEEEEEEEDIKRKPPKKVIIKRKEDKKSIKTKVMEKKVDKVASKVMTLEHGRKKEKKVYDLPGQKHDPPEERDPLRIFYETLYQQLPDSEMAQYWMMEYGLLPLEVAEKIYAKKLKKNPQSRLISPVKAVSTKKTVSMKALKQVSAGKTSKVTAKRKLVSTSSDDDDDDFMAPRRKPKKQKVSC